MCMTAYSSLSIHRLQACQPDVEVWQRILQVRALVLRPADDSTTWIKFANLCRKSGRMILAEKTINSLFSPTQVRSFKHAHLTHTHMIFSCNHNTVIYNNPREHLHMLFTPILNSYGRITGGKKAYDISSSSRKIYRETYTLLLATPILIQVGKSSKIFRSFLRVAGLSKANGKWTCTMTGVRYGRACF